MKYYYFYAYGIIEQNQADDLEGCKDFRMGYQLLGSKHGYDQPWSEERIETMEIVFKSLDNKFEKFGKALAKGY